MGKKRSYKINTIKELYAKSGNQCAFSGCENELFINDNFNISEICHIEGLNKDSARYNNLLSEEEANGIDNLILLCPTHHTIVDKDVKTYTVQKLRNMKLNHENNIIQSKLIHVNNIQIDDKYINKIYKYPKLNHSISREKIQNTIQKTLIQNYNTRMILYKLITSYEEYSELKMSIILNELECDANMFAQYLKLLEDLGYVKEDYYIGGMESFIEGDDGNLYIVSDNYLFKLYNGTWRIKSKFRILLDIYNLLGKNSFYEFIVSKDYDQLNKL